MCPAFLQFWCNVVNLLIKLNSTVISVSCMFEYVCNKPFSLKKLQMWKISYAGIN